MVNENEIAQKIDEAESNIISCKLLTAEAAKNMGRDILSRARLKRLIVTTVLFILFLIGGFIIYNSTHIFFVILYVIIGIVIIHFIRRPFSESVKSVKSQNKNLADRLENIKRAEY